MTTTSPSGRDAERTLSKRERDVLEHMLAAADPLSIALRKQAADARVLEG